MIFVTKKSGLHLQPLMRISTENDVTTHLNRTTGGSDDTNDSDSPKVAGDGESRGQVQLVELKDPILG